MPRQIYFAVSSTWFSVQSAIDRFVIQSYSLIMNTKRAQVEVFERRRRHTDVVTMPIPFGRELPRSNDPIWKLGQATVQLLCQYLDGP